jgi:hypothetical protein
VSSTAEYDAFGPWIYEIKVPDDVPRVFRDHPLDVEGSRMVIKVPRIIDRRDANPTMDLYDVVLAVGSERLTVLTRRGHSFDARDVAFDEIQGIIDIVDLLDGRLTLSTDDGDVTIGFNGASADVITRLVRVLRGVYVRGAGRRAGGAATGARDAVGNLSEIDLDLRNLHHRLTRELGDVAVVAVQPRHGVELRSGNFAQRMVDRAWRTVLTSAVVSLTDREVQVLGRGRSFMRGYKPVHALGRTLLPRERIRSVGVRPSDEWTGVSLVEVRVGHVVHEFALDDERAEAVATALRPAGQAPAGG